MSKLKQQMALRQIALDRILDVYTCAHNARSDNTYYTAFKMRYLKLDDIYEEFNNTHSAVMQYLSTQDNASDIIEEEKNIQIEIDKKYYSVKTIFYDIFERSPPPSNQNVTQSNVKLPQLHVPQFNGDMKAWPTFSDLYKSLIHDNKSLSKIEKFQYLLSCLSGEALLLSKNLPITEDNYDKVYKNLEKRYQNKRLLATVYWEQINNFPKITTESSRSLRNLLDVFSDNLAALKTLNLPIDSWDFVLFHILSKKIDTCTLKRFEMEYASSDIPEYKVLYKFLNKQCIAYDSVALVQPNKKYFSDPSPRGSTFKKPIDKFNASSFLTSTNETNRCLVCKDSHSIYKCPVFSAKSPKQRYELCKQNKWCTNCLGSKHSAKHCNSESCCRVCKDKRHHTLLHFCENNIKPPHPVETDSIPSMSHDELSSIQPSTSQVLTNLLPSTSTVLLSTAIVDVLDIHGNIICLRILLDSGSQASFITEECAKRLALPRSKFALNINGLGNMRSAASSFISVSLRPHGKTTPVFDIDSVILTDICADTPVRTLPVGSLSHIANLHLADDKFNIPGRIDMLLGAEVFSRILKEGKISGKDNEPSAVNTEFGWIIMGKYLSDTQTTISSFVSVCDTPLESTLKRFWELENIPCSYSTSPDDEKCETLFEQNHFRTALGRYVVSLPFQIPEPYFGNTRSQALARFNSLERKLLKNPSLYIQYSDFMKDYLMNNYMEAVDTPKTFENTFYIPHHAVFNPNSSTTKLRVVFDASIKSPAGPSLNDTLFVGAKLQQDIMVILLNFRLHTYAFTADLKHMFLQILIQENQQDYQRIVWRFSPRDPVQDFKLKTVAFGICSSPFLALRTIAQLCKDEQNNYPNACSVLTRDIYVDDIITGSDTIEKARSLQSELRSLLKKGCFELRKWASNHPSLLDHLPPKDCQQSPLSFATHDFVLKILGLRWNPTLDFFSYDVTPLDRECSKRIILSEVAKIFDPLGFLAPLSFFAKYLIKYLWILGLDWDQLPPPEVIEKWTQYKKELPQLSGIKIPRHIPNTFSSCQLHGFSDSSEKGYAGVVYLRLSFPDETHKVFLICAKSRVAPTKALSIARLELCGAVLLADLISFVVATYADKISIDRVFAWTDSMVALSWIKAPSYRWKTFVCNRVGRIQEKVSPDNWYHIDTKLNPADCASRGLLPSELMSHPLWFSGPPWLATPSHDWPVDFASSLVPTDLERKDIVLSTFISVNSLDALLGKYSSLSKIKRIVAYMLRFINNLKTTSHKSTASITQTELHKALLIIVKGVQHSCFSHEIEQLENKLPLPKTFRKLNPFLGEDGLLRVGGRLQNSGLAFDHKHPAILPRCHRLTELIIEDTHREYFHPGLQTLHFLIAQNFWILSPKRAIRQVLAKCLRCFRVNPRPLEPFMGNLPHVRINQVKPFSCVGVDFGGPFFVTPSKGRGIKSQKAYICLFVCAATKAIHLELVSDLTSQAFLAALRRFIARRGRCSQIFSDNGTNFIGASRILADLFKDATETEKISWSFQVPAGPHFNGLSEAGIKSVKSHLIRVIGSQILTFEEFYTLLTQVESILNSRPLYSMSSDPNDMSVLTPGHFLTQEPLTVLPDPDLSHLKLSQLDRWQLLQKLFQDIWNRWHSEYLHTLQQRQKWLNKEHYLRVGDLVVVKNENVPPLNWRMARVEKLFPGSDGVARVASIRTSHGLLQRPLVKLCPIPSQLAVK